MFNARHFLVTAKYSFSGNKKDGNAPSKSEIFSLELLLAEGIITNR